MRKIQISHRTTLLETCKRRQENQVDMVMVVRGRLYIYMPTIFKEIRKFSGKRKGVWLTEQKVKHIHIYIIRNCGDVLPYEK